MECNIEKNKQNCKCTYVSCGKRGRCCDCIKSHFSSGEFPGCVFPADVEAGYDRSIENFIETYKQRGAWW